MFDLLEPVWFDGVTKTLHRCLAVADLDLVLMLLVERLERLLGRCPAQPPTQITHCRSIILNQKTCNPMANTIRGPHCDLEIVFIR